MKFSFRLLLVLFLSGPSLHAFLEDAPSTNKNCVAGALENIPPYPCGGIFPSDSAEDSDPFEPFNRCIFEINLGLDYILIEPIAWAYKEVVPEYMRTRIGYILRNLNEPIVLANNNLCGFSYIRKQL